MKLNPPKLEHNRFVVSNLEDCVSFYQNLFGFEISWEGKQPTGERWVHLKKGEMYLSISQAVLPKNKRIIPEDYSIMNGYQHMGWVVQDIEDYKNVLMENEINYKEVKTEVGNHIYFFDPANNEIELTQYKRNSA